MGEGERAKSGREEVLEWMGSARAARERPPRMNSVGFTPTRRAQPSRVGALTAEFLGAFFHSQRSHVEAPASLPTNCGTADTMRVRRSPGRRRGIYDRQVNPARRAGSETAAISL